MPARKHSANRGQTDCREALSRSVVGKRCREGDRYLTSARRERSRRFWDFEQLHHVAVGIARIGGAHVPKG